MPFLSPRDEKQYYGADLSENSFSPEHIQHVINSIHNVPEWYNSIVEKAENNGCSVDEQLYLDALWVISDNRNNGDVNLTREIGYKIPPMTPFVGRNFNVTRAGIHADGLLKDDEIYNVFDTAKILNRPASVMIGKASGLAGIAYWINGNYNLTGENAIKKHDPLVTSLKEWIDKEYEDGRQTSLSTAELEEKIEQLSGGKMRRL